MDANQKVKAFIVEDDHFVAELVRVMLRQAGYEVVGHAFSGEQALGMLPTLIGTPQQPDVILMDYLLPGINGLEAVQQIEAQWPLPVVMLSAYDTPDLVAEASDAGVGAYLVKPPTSRELDRAITIAIARYGDLRAMRDINAKLEIVLAELKIANTRLVEQERMAAVGLLAANIAHNFNNLLAPVLLYAELTLKTPELPPKLREPMQSVIAQVRHAVELIQGMLDYSRSAWIMRRPVNLVDVLDDTQQVLQAAWPANIAVKINSGPGPYMIGADPLRIRQALVNVALNARDAMPDGGWLIFHLDEFILGRTEPPPLQEMQPGLWMRLVIADTGVGIAPEVLPRIFEPFYTTYAPLKVGMGLAQTYGIVAQHGGHIQVSSTVGKGTTCTIYLPAAMPKPETPIDRETPAEV